MDGPELSRQDRAAEHRWQSTVFHSLRTGVRLLVPLLITVFLLGFAINFLFNALAPAISAASLASGGFLPHILVQLLVLIGLFTVIFLVGYIAEHRDGDRQFANRFDDLMASLPGVGAVYSSSRKAGDILIDNDTDSFREVKLVEYPREGSFTVGFLTDDSPDTIAEATVGEGGDMQSVFVPFSPNPFMGGLLLHVSEDQLYEVDMTVKEAVTVVMTSGVTSGDNDEQPIEDMSGTGPV